MKKVFNIIINVFATIGCGFLTRDYYTNHIDKFGFYMIVLVLSCVTLIFLIDAIKLITE